MNSAGILSYIFHAFPNSQVGNPQIGNHDLSQEESTADGTSQRLLTSLAKWE